MMKMELDCIREVLLFLESLETNVPTNVQTIQTAYPHRTVEEIDYVCLKLHEGGLIRAISASSFTEPEHTIGIIGMTYAGHQFLDNIRDEDTFTGIKKTLIKVGGTASLAVISELSSLLIKKQLGL